MQVKATRVRRRRIRKATGRAAWVAVLAAGTLLYAEVSGGVEIAGGPSPAVRLEASPVRIEAPVSMAAPVEDVGIWVVERSTANGETRGRGGLTVQSVGRPSVRAAHVVVLGKDHDVVTNAATVGQLLSAMGIEPDGNDRVSPPPRTPLSRKRNRIDVVDVTFRTAQVASTIPYTTKTEYTKDLEPGEVKVVRAGSDGRELLTIRRRVENGRVVSSRVVARQVTKPMVAKVRRVGTFVHDADGDRTEVGNASWYDHPGMTAASPWLAMGTRVTVENLANGKTVTVVINDRGPFGGGLIDLSDQAFAQLAPLSQGIVKVRISW